MTGTKGFTSSGLVVGQTVVSSKAKKSEHLKGNKVTMGNGLPRDSEGTVGDITVRRLGAFGLKCYIKTNSGWYDLITMQSATLVQWVPMSLSGTWAIDDTYGTPEYFKDGNGFVHLRGGVDSGSLTSTITTLPEGFRPNFEQRRLVNRVINASIYIQEIKIADTGVINRPYASYIALDDTVTADTTAEICFDGISFFAGQTITGQGGGSGTGGGGSGVPDTGGSLP